MTPLPTITDVYRVAMNWHESGTGQIAENVIHVRITGSTAAAVATGVDAAFRGDQWEPVVNTAGFTSLDVTPLDGSSATVHHTVTGLNTGEATGEWVPSAAAIVSFYTALRGRSNRGRFFTPFVAESHLQDGLLTGATGPAMQAAWVAFAAALPTGMKHVVASYLHRSANDVTSYVVKQAYGTQRRRQTRVRYP